MNSDVELNMESEDRPVVIVTGAAQGIGAAIAERFCRDGACVVLVDANSPLLLQQCERLKSAGYRVVGCVANVTQPAAMADMVKTTLAEFDRIDVLVNNAGIIRDGFIGDISEQDWDAVIDVNLKGTFMCCQAVFPHFKSRTAGRIVNIASRAWLGNIGQANYAASKGGVVSLTRTLALEFARYQVNVNAVAPGLIDTPMTQSMPAHARERLLRMQPTGKMGSVTDIAAAVAFLASAQAEFITGQILHVDGGKSCGLLSL